MIIFHVPIFQELIHAPMQFNLFLRLFFIPTSLNWNLCITKSAFWKKKNLISPIFFYFGPWRHTDLRNCVTWNGIEWNAVVSVEQFELRFLTVFKNRSFSIWPLKMCRGTSRSSYRRLLFIIWSSWLWSIVLISVSHSDNCLFLKNSRYFDWWRRI